MGFVRRVNIHGDFDYWAVDDNKHGRLRCAESTNALDATAGAAWEMTNLKCWKKMRGPEVVCSVRAVEGAVGCSPRGRWLELYGRVMRVDVCHDPTT